MNAGTRRIVRIITNPLLLFSFLWRYLFPWFGSFALRSEFDALDRPNYAFGMLQAARLARALGISRISVMEFGVARGNGLLAMERIAEEVKKSTGIDCDVYGFDLGSGLPAAGDYRDLPYFWSQGSYRMDRALLEKKLKKAKLVLGDVKKTLEEVSNGNLAPIGFVAFDLDYYSSTVNALRIFDIPSEKLLPRVFCYFDDTIGDDHALCSDYTGELLAIREFNDAGRNMKLTPIHGFEHQRIVKDFWHAGIYVLHIFDHPLYCKRIGANAGG